MKKLSKLLLVIILLGVVIACQNSGNKESNQSEKTEITEQPSDESIDMDEQEGPISETSIAPIEINPATIKTGDIILGHEVKSVNYQSEFVFEFVLSGDFCFDGQLSLGMSADIEFTPNESTRDKAQIVIGDVQKPLYMWTTFTNTGAFYDALGEDNVQKLEQGEMMDCAICFKNYTVIAMETEIKAEAEFVSMDNN